MKHSINYCSSNSRTSVKNYYKFFNPLLAPRKVFSFFQLISYIKNLTMIKGSGLKFLVLYRGGKKK